MSASQEHVQVRVRTPARAWRKKRKTLVRIVLVTILVSGVGGYFGRPWINRWMEQRKVERAGRSLERGDFSRAILDSRAVLESNPVNLEANRLIAKALEASGSPAALHWRIRFQSLRSDDVENSLSLAKDALNAGEVPMAARTLENLKSDQSANPDFHDVSAQLAFTLGNMKSAEAHWQEASRLAPRVNSYRVKLAALHLDSKDPAIRSVAEISLRELAEGQDGIVARRVLLVDSKKHGGPVRVRALADALVAAPASTFVDKLTRLEVLRASRAPDSVSYLEDLRKVAEPNPEDFYQLLLWMNRNDLATVASEWLAAMPAKALAKPPVCVGAAQTFLKAGQWEKLREMTEQGGSWEDMDFTRRAFLARALERFEEPEQSALEWNKAVSAAQSREDGPYRMERLATLAGRWHWEQREEDLLWRIARSGRSPGWVLDSLWRKAAKRSNTAQLQEVAGFIAKTAPGDVTARNTYTFLCLLKRTQEGNPHHQSAVLYRDNPANPAVAVTYALSLYQQGKINEALAVTSAISLEELRKAESYAFYHAVFLIAAERGAEAEKFLEFVARRAVLPEEKAILQREKEFAAKRAEQAREKALGEPQKPGATVPQ